ncbi:LSU ribosomal protein L3P [Giardia duodenalis]|uniref:Ribosomal protein L3 n=2 Tax=Giardia intestinalis TaxID=5741 RepID=C6LNP3_GIAIB|nr:Ribosomal protein L3 [Giardia intestinalis ATCC 50581]ESU45355.1 LSU ribosomal protein L3P [Giardia intestinalis]
MSHRKFSCCRKGNLGYLPRKRCTRGRGRCKTFPPDVQGTPIHLTAFLGYKAGCTHVMRFIDHRGSNLHNRQAIDQATIIDAPPMICTAIIGYAKTPKGLRAVTTVWAAHIAEPAMRRFYRNYFHANKTAFSTYMKKAADGTYIKEQLGRLKEHADVIRIVAHTQPALTPLKQKKADIMEIQVNGGKSVAEKVDYAYALMEKPISIKDVFEVGKQIDTISITRGRGFEGVVTRWGVTRLPRKTRRGNRKVACIGSWHPANVQYTVARAGQMGYFHRTDTNKQVFMIDTAENPRCCTTEFDLTDKSINPVGGFVNYGRIQGDFIMIKGTCPGPKRRPVVMRSSLLPHRNYPPVQLQWISTASKFGHGIFETVEERRQFYAK